MPRAIQVCYQTTRLDLPKMEGKRKLIRITQGILVKCDPSIKAILAKINAENGHDFIIEDIDDEHVLVKSAKHDVLKSLLKDVSI
ncbi:hypothetical protein AC579_7830 [Pseudocercospora musae]|uniref:General transcription and DNA repair factor IIH subunit TFB5 n=1 Tax=Pseudocercospora musae TaxID=113226 RepID=A0A139I4M3_9PEZI|nr:hypothetical protein AC579_7830 [Pseudocercospora musae]